MAITQLDGNGLQLGHLSSSPSAVSGSTLLYTKGNQLFMNVNNTGEVSLKPLDIDHLDDLGGTAGASNAPVVADSDNLVVSDDGTEKKIHFADFAADIFRKIDNASSDVAIGLSGSLTLADNSVGVAEIAAAIAGDGLKGGAGQALAIEPNDFAGAGLEDDGSDNLRLASQGTGIAGGGGTTLSVAAAQTSITSVLNAGLTVGRDTDNVVDFATVDDVIILKAAGSERMRADSAGVDVVGTLSSSVAVQGGAASFASLATSGDVTVAGDLTVNGDLVQQNVSQLVVEDTLIGLGYGASATGSAGDRGLIMGLDGANAAAMIWDNGSSQFAFARTSTDNKATEAVIAAYAPVRMAAVQATTLSGSSTLDVDGEAKLNGDVKVKGLTSSRVVFAGADGLLSDDGNMTFATDTLTVTKLGAFTAAGAINFDSQNMTNVDIDSGTIDGATIATSDVTVGASKTLDVSAGTLTLADDQIAAAKVTGLDGTGLSDASGVLSVDAAQPQISTVGVLASGSIASGFGAISTANNITTTATISGSQRVQGGAATFASLSIGDGNITNVGVIEADTIQSDADAVGLNVNFDGNTTKNKITLKDNLADALNINEGGTSYLKFVTTDDGEKITLGKKLEAGSVEIEGSNFDIDGGAIDGTIIGAASAAALTASHIVGQAGLDVTGIEAANKQVRFFRKDNSTVPMIAIASGSTGGKDVLALRTGETILGFTTDFGTGPLSGLIQNISNHMIVSGSDVVRIQSGRHASDHVEFGEAGAPNDVIFYGQNQDGTADGHEKLFWDSSENALVFNDENAEYLRVGGNDHSSTGDFAITVADGSANINKIKAAAFVTYSDRELKKDITPMTDALDKVMALDAVSYRLKNGNSQEIGFIAQDVAHIVPEVCSLDANGVGRGIDYSRMTALLASAVKTQQAQIDNLQKVIANLQK